ncbi:hypothetical protein MPTK1_3g01480 [Marchantia polymorpha subsp. ruderalis]|uniref:Uncharacterized protein n=2 Tax=Marchantia polymorpha TaxID=3197 RepID=A0AAF6AWB8_MARPO|nr:hypothetical protein MARPO_0007s0140 [Marchantia polymorpha]BBN04052.1 hypothetical protein Mp_3g01480 [Marchantia polymorpha subsp. ruderalis]|eukprot:PTQ47739.1 hypothetical protein MARPO_0007s0140 [Marchantia polymorpha]
MALARVETGSKRVAALIVILLLGMLAFAPSALGRPVPSGWDLSLSTGSSDSTLWRHFTTKSQASGYHRLLLDMEKSLEVATNLPENGDEKQAAPIDSYAEDVFTTMDYANPRSNASGSSDDLSPPMP